MKWVWARGVPVGLINRAFELGPHSPSVEKQLPASSRANLVVHKWLYCRRAETLLCSEVGKVLFASLAHFAHCKVREKHHDKR